MRSLLLLLFLGVVLPFASAGTHSLKYFYTAVSGDIDFPEFTAVGLVDNGQFMYFDSNTNEAAPKTEWMRQNTGKDYWDSQTQPLIGTHQAFKNNIQILKERFNQTKSTGVHTFQFMYGCEVDDETGDTEGFYQYGYDGEDFISLDLKNMRYVAPIPEAVITKQKWEREGNEIQRFKDYSSHSCIDWLKKYMKYGRTSLERTVPPEVSLLQKDSFSPVECRATGFYPRQVTISWQKNGQDLLEDVELVDTLPNGDGTFQKSSRLTVSAKELTDHKYSCVVDHKSSPEKIIKTWVPADNTGIIIGIVVAVVLIAVIAGVGLFIWKRSKSGYGKTSTSDSDSDNSGTPVQKA